MRIYSVAEGRGMREEEERKERQLQCRGGWVEGRKFKEKEKIGMEPLGDGEGKGEGRE